MQGLRQKVARSYNGMVIEFSVFLQCHDQLVCLLVLSSTLLYYIISRFSLRNLNKYLLMNYYLVY